MVLLTLDAQLAIRLGRPTTSVPRSKPSQKRSRGAVEVKTRQFLRSAATEITRWPVDMETKGDADFFVFIELDLRTMAPTFYVLTNAQARATFRDYIGGGNCYPGEVRKLIRPNDFSALLPTPEAVISEFQ